MLNIFEKKNNTVAFVVVLAAAISWGSFSPMVSYIQVKFLPSLAFAFISVFFAALITLFLAIVLKIKFRDILNELLTKKAKKARSYLLMRGLSSYNLIILIMGFYLLENKIVGIIIYELYPIVTVFLSYFYYKDYQGKNIWYVITVIVVSTSALVLFLLKQKNIETPSDLFYFLKQENSLGLLCVFIGAILNGFYVIYGKLLTEECNKIFTGIKPVRHVFITQGLVYTFVMIGLLLINIVYYWFFSTENEIKELLEIDFFILLLIIFFAFFTNILVDNLARLGHSISDSHYIYLLWMLSPIVGILSLWIFGFGEISYVIVLSFILILVANLLLNMNIEKKFSFKVFLFGFCCLLLFYLILPTHYWYFLL